MKLNIIKLILAAVFGGVILYITKYSSVEIALAVLTSIITYAVLDVVDMNIKFEYLHTKINSFEVNFFKSIRRLRPQHETNK